jgi:hypothetical protein
MTSVKWGNDPLVRTIYEPDDLVAGSSRSALAPERHLRASCAGFFPYLRIVNSATRAKFMPPIMKIVIIEGALDASLV